MINMPPWSMRTRTDRTTLDMPAGYVLCGSVKIQRGVHQKCLEATTNKGGFMVK